MDVRMPDGTIISGVPEGVTQTELLERYNKYAGAATAETPEQGLPSLAGPKQAEMKPFEPSALEEIQNVGRRGLLQAKQTQNTLAFQAGLMDPATYTEKTRELERRMGAAAPSGDVAAGMERLQAANATGNYGDVIAELTKAKNLKALGSLVGESAVATGETIPFTVAGGLTGGPTGAAAATGLVSFGMEYGSAMADLLNEKGIDPSNTLAVRNAVEDPAFLAAAQERGIKRGIPVAAFDALSAGFAGRFINNLERAVASKTITGKAIPKAMAVAAGKEAGIQVGAGMGGEAVAQAATGESKPLDVLLEGIAELPGGISEVATNVRNARQQAAPSVAAEEPTRAKYERPAADQGLEALARAKGFLQPEQPAPVAEAPAPEVNLDREAELRDLMEQTARAEGKPIPQATPTEEPPSITMLQSPVAETQQPAAEAPVAEPVAEETPVEVKAEAPVSEQEMDPKERLRRANVSMFNAQRMLANGQITADQYDDLKRQYDAIKLRASDIAQRAKQPIIPSVEPKGEYKETKSLETFFTNYKDDKKRLEGLPKYGQPEVKQVVAELNQAIQKVTDAINAKGYSADAIKHKVPAEVRPLFNQFSTLTGGGSRLLMESERVGNNKKLASPEKLAKAIEESQADVANAYKFLGIEPEAVAPTPVAPAPVKKVAKETPLRQASYAKNPFMTFLADKGLYHAKGKPNSMKSEFSPDKTVMVSGHGPVFKASGLQVDAMLPIAIEYGYLPQDATEGDLSNLIRTAMSGKKVEPLYSAQGVEDTAAKYEERMAEEEVAYEERAGQTDAEWHGMSEQEYMDLMAREVAAVSDADFAELDQAINELSDAPAGNMSVRAAMEALGFTEQEIQDEENRNAPKADEAVTGEQTQGDEASQAAPTLELETQTAEELKSKQDEIDRLTKENERLAKQAEAKAKADAERDEFVLTGSDRAADVAAAQGQKDIFGAMEEEAPAQPKTPVAKAEKPEVASEVVGPAEKPAAPKLTREPVTIEGEFTEVGEEKQRALITDQTKKLSDAQVSTLEKFYGFARDTEEFANAARQDVVNFITKGATYVNGKIRAIIRSMANGVLSVAVAFNPQFVSMPYTIAVPQFETRIEQVMQEVPASVQKQMSEDAKRAYATIYPAIKGELQANDKFFIVADKQTANTFVFNPDGSPFMQSKTLFGAGIGDFIKGNNNIVSNRITPAGLFDLGLRDAKRSVDEAATAGEYDFGKVFVLDKSQKGSTGLYSTTIMHSVWTKEADAKQRLAALQKPGAEDSRYSFGCINVDKETYGKLVTNNLAQMDGAKIFIVPENGKDVMSFVNGEATYSTDIIRQRAEPVTKETKQEVQRAAETAATERSVVGKEEEGLLYNDLFTRSVTSEEKKRAPSFKRRMDKLNRDRVKGKISDEQFINEADWALKQAENERHSKGVAERVRGADFIRQKLLEAKRKGDLSPEAVDLAEWFIRNNEQLVDDLGVSVRAPSASGVGGQYSTMSRIIILMKDAGSDVTVVHEILHHLERMMPPKVQQAIRDAWAKQLLAAQKKAKTPAEKLYFNALINAHYGNNDVSFLDAADGEMSKVFMKALAEMDFDQPGNKSAMKLAETLLKMGAVPYQNYEYFNPSEFWAVNGADIVQGRFNAVQGGVLARLKNWLKELAQKIKGMFGLNSDAAILKALDSLSKSDGQFVTKEMLGEGDYKNLHRNYRGNDAPDSAWTSMDEDKLDTAIYNIADKHIDTKRVIENIRKTSGDIAEDWDAYTKEELYHGRTAKAINDFLDNEMLPITKEMKANNVTLDELDEYLHNRHAEERNIQINRINPDPKLQDRGSGIATKDAVKYLSELSPERAKIFESLAAQVDSIVTKTQGILVKSGMETQQTIDDWNNAYEHYVPLQRDDLEYVHTGSGISGGYATRGKTSKRATGSLKSVVDIFENIAIQRERAVMKAERARVGRALYGLAIKYPNPEFWLPVNPDAIKNKGDLVKELVAMGLSPMDAENLFQEPTVADIDKKTGEVKYVINQNNRYSENVFPIRINGQDRFIIFNGSDPRAERMVKAMKNLDAEQLGVVVGAIGEVTRFLASVNTQYNPVFGAWNFLRDVQGAALNLSTTEIAGNEKKVLEGISPIKGMPALRAIYRDLRGKGATTPEMQEWVDLFEQYQKAGGATGYKDQFSKGRDAPGIVERELKKLDRGNVRKAADAVFNWLSDYNDAMENAVRLSAFKVALDQGLSEDKAASIAKNLTVNFNRKGAASPTFQALYAFFNASVQGTARLAETLKGPAGRKIMAGGFMIGVAQALALAMAGFDDDDPPEFLKNKNLIIPTTGGNYLIVPMPMGFSMFPGVGRLVTEYMLGQGGMITGAKGAGDKVVSAASLILDSFNPLGSGSFLQMLAPTPADPLVAIATNRDAFGRPIAKEDRATSPTPGYTRSRENASYVSKKLAEFLNYVSSPMGTKYTKGGISPTADQLDYLAGQIGGGVSRELLKTGEYLSAVAKGETSDTPSYRVPIVGKMYGETETPAAISSKFYQNVTLLAEMENEIKSRQKNREDTKEYRADHPESRLINRANYLENQITALNKQKKLLQEKDAPAERIKKIDEQKAKLMKGLNDQIKRLQQ